MEYGYVYCFSNPELKCLKVGMTMRTPDVRLKEANLADTWRPPAPYKIEFAKKVSNPYKKEKTLHKLLEQYTIRVNPKREFFQVSPEEVLIFFDLMDGEMWKETLKEDLENEEEEEEEEEEECVINDGEELSIRIKNGKVVEPRGCRDMAKCFMNGQRISHTIGINKAWICVYDSYKNALIYNGKIYKKLYHFTKAHYQLERPDRTSENNAWKECRCEVEGEWISTYNLQEIN